VKSIFFASDWRSWPKFTEEHFNYTLQLYRNLGLNVYVIQQPAVQPFINILGLYKKLSNEGKLTDKALRNLSTTREKYDIQQNQFLEFFVKFNRTRGFSLIRIDDIVCDKSICPMGTSKFPFYFDYYHMTWTGASRLKNKFQTYLTL
jgi:hypothetical protein